MDNASIQPSNMLSLAGSSLPRGVPIPLHEVAVLLHPDDDVAIARVPLSRGVILKPAADNGSQLEVTQRIQTGHKLAVRNVAEGQPVHRYGSRIGFATQPIQVGSHVHSHNLAVGELAQEYAYGEDVRPVDFVCPELRRTFMGYKRPDGRAGTRNYIAIISSVNCAASTIR